MASGDLRVFKFNVQLNKIAEYDEDGNISQEWDAFAAHGFKNWLVLLGGYRLQTVSVVNLDTQTASDMSSFETGHLTIAYRCYDTYFTTWGPHGGTCVSYTYLEPRLSWASEPPQYGCDNAGTTLTVDDMSMEFKDGCVSIADSVAGNAILKLGQYSHAKIDKHTEVRWDGSVLIVDNCHGESFYVERD